MTDVWDVPDLDSDSYKNACLDIATNEKAFDTFKQNADYCRILEHVSYEEGKAFLNSISNLDVITSDHINGFKENDIYGSPTIQSFEKFGDLSPSTLRYVANAMDAISFAGNNLKHIVEIGGGYGGLCKVFSTLIDFDNYQIIDLPEANAVAKKYLGKFENLNGRTNQVSCYDYNVIKGIDLVVSNYAYSECTRDVQLGYYNNIVLNASKFYFIYNNITHNNINSDGFIEMASKDFDLNIREESVSNHRNYIIYGTKK